MPVLSRWLCAALLALLLGAAGVPLAHAASPSPGPAFGLRPVRYDPQRPATQSYFVYDAVPGQTSQDAVLVRNSGSQAGTVRLAAVDSTTGETSGAVYLASDAPRQAVATWLTLSQTTFTLGPGAEQEVSFTLTVPASAGAGQYLGGLVAEDAAPPVSSAGGAVQVQLQSRAVTAVQVNLPGPVVEDVAVTGITAGGAQGYQQLQLGLRNDGTTLVKPTGTLTVTDQTGQERQHLTLSLDTFLPHTAIQYPVLVQHQALGAGTYQVTVDLTYGTQGHTYYQGAVTITPAQVAQVFAPATNAAPLAPPPAAGTAALPNQPGRGQPWWRGDAGLGLGAGLALLLLGLARWRLARRRAAVARSTAAAGGGDA